MNTDDVATECHLPENALPTFKIVGDNIDKHVKPRDMRLDHQSQSLHYFHAYAVRDRIDLSSFSNDNPDQARLCNADVEELLPSCDDKKDILDNFCILIAHCLQRYMPFMKQLSKRSLERHIKHDHYAEMSTQSKIVIGREGSMMLDNQFQCAKHSFVNFIIGSPWSHS